MSDKYDFIYNIAEKASSLNGVSVTTIRAILFISVIPAILIIFIWLVRALCSISFQDQDEYEEKEWKRIIEEAKKGR